MDTNPTALTLPAPRARRQHSAEFKARAIAACLQPGVSVAAVALANQLNANYLRKLVKTHREQAPVDGTSNAGRGESRERSRERSPTLVPVTVAPEAAPAAEDIRIEIRRQQTVVQITWPVAQATACGQWLREIVR